MRGGAPGSWMEGEDAYVEAPGPQLQADDPRAEACVMGWSVPPAAPIPVALAGAPDAIWSLEPDELGL